MNRPSSVRARSLDRGARFPLAAVGLVLAVSPLAAQGTASLSNLSVRSSAGSGAQTLIAGFVIGGSGSKAVLIRGDGPALTQFGVPGALADPVLGLFGASGAEISSNSKWGGSPALSGVFSQLGAFPLPTDSLDAALYQPLDAGAYTAQISSTSGDSGVALVEVYDADQGLTASRFVNLSARSQAGSGSQALIAGFYVAGTGTETVLVRGVGPALSTYGVTGLLANPQLTLFDASGKPVASNAGWGTAPVPGDSPVPAQVTSATAALFAQLGAFPLAAGSADCALVASLPPGSYTANVSGAGAAGVALVEIYEVAGAPEAGSAPVFAVQPSSGTLPPGGTCTVSVSISGTATFQWYLDGNAIPGADASSYAASQPGTYYVVATNAYGSTTSNLAAVTAASGITAPVTDLGAAAGNVFYVTFDQDVYQALGLMPQNVHAEVDFSWDGAGAIANTSTGAGAAGGTFSIKTTGTVGVGAGSTASGTPLQFEWTYSDSNGVLIGMYFDGGYNPATLGQDIGTFEGAATVLYETSGGSEFADIGFVASYSATAPANPSF